jgi:hypothetical protein
MLTKAALISSTTTIVLLALLMRIPATRKLVLGA